ERDSWVELQQRLRLLPPTEGTVCASFSSFQVLQAVSLSSRCSGAKRVTRRYDSLTGCRTEIICHNLSSGTRMKPILPSAPQRDVLFLKLLTPWATGCICNCLKLDLVQ